ncbi:MAG TPA: hypothetical protein VLI94_05970 [Solirubrobacterales bacterium]|nr:hypothetical protein [Solirubrobacterales bacterium]
MEFENALPELSENPQDARGDWGAAEADEVVYRLGLSCALVPGLPEELWIGDVQVRFVRGPVRAQRTEIRQRFGLPVVFDKSMKRVEIGDDEVIALLSLSTTPVPDDLEAGFAGWRAHALAAAGMLASVLDERVAGAELFEDAIFLRRGTFVGAADIREKVRTYLPFEVNPADKRALERLNDLSASESSAVARAARLYRRAALEGPTADAYAMLWVAAECFSEHRSPSRKDIEAALSAAGLNPEGLPISVGRLIELRGKIQHHGVESDDRLTTAFYEMEAVVRTLIRQEAGLEGGWWAASDNPAGFAAPFDAAVAQLHGRGISEWHVDQLPSPETPRPLRIPRTIPNPQNDPRIDLAEGFGDTAHLIAGVVLDAIEWIDPGFSLQIRLGRPPEAPPSAPFGANADSLWISKEGLDGVGDPEKPHLLVNLVWDLVGLVGFAVAQRVGAASRGNGVPFVQAFGSWLQYERLVKHGDFEAEALSIPSANDPISLGKLCGWAAAGDLRAEASVQSLEGETYELGISILETLREIPLAAPLHLLDSSEEPAGTER